MSDHEALHRESAKILHAEMFSGCVQWEDDPSDTATSGSEADRRRALDFARAALAPAVRRITELEGAARMWEEEARAVLATAQQYDAERDALREQLAECEAALAEVGPIAARVHVAEARVKELEAALQRIAEMFGDARQQEASYLIRGEGGVSVLPNTREIERIVRAALQAAAIHLREGEG